MYMYIKIYLSRSEEDFGDAKFEVFVPHSDGTEQGPAKCSGIQTGQFTRETRLVPEVKVQIL